MSEAVDPERRNACPTWMISLAALPTTWAPASFSEGRSKTSFSIPPDSPRIWPRGFLS